MKEVEEMPKIAIKGGKESLEQVRESSRGKNVYRQRKDGSVVMARWPKPRHRKRAE